MRSRPTRPERKSVREAAVRIDDFFEIRVVAIRSQNGQSAPAARRHDGGLSRRRRPFRHIARGVD